MAQGETLTLTLKPLQGAESYQRQQGGSPQSKPPTPPASGPSPLAQKIASLAGQDNAGDSIEIASSWNAPPHIAACRNKFCVRVSMARGRGRGGNQYS